MVYCLAHAPQISSVHVVFFKCCLFWLASLILTKRELNKSLLVCLVFGVAAAAGVVVVVVIVVRQTSTMDRECTASKQADKHPCHCH